MSSCDDKVVVVAVTMSSCDDEVVVVAVTMSIQWKTILEKGNHYYIQTWHKDLPITILF